MKNDAFVRWSLGLGIPVVFFYFFQGILAPFIVGMVVAYALNPAVVALARVKLPRAVGAFAIVAIFVVCISALILTIAPLLQVELLGLLRRMPTYSERLLATIKPLIDTVTSHLSPNDLDKITGVVNDNMGDVVKWMAGFLGDILTSGLALANVLSLAIITPVVSFYMLKDWDDIVVKVNSLIPYKSRPTVQTLLHRIDTTFAGFARGQALVCLIMAVYYSAGLMLMDLDFALIIGIVTGLLTCIPYVGFFMGTVSALLVAAMQFSDMSSLGKVALVFGIGIALEGYALTPRFVGDRIGLHPIWIIFAVLAGFHLKGFLGVLVALPFASACGVVLRFIVEHYKKSSLYLSER